MSETISVAFTSSPKAAPTTVSINGFKAAIGTVVCAGIIVPSSNTLSSSNKLSTCTLPIESA